jgi:S-adenosylmethionine synthetase
VFAHRLVRRQAELRRSGGLPWLGPDAKSQVTFRYEDGRPVAIEAVVLSTQHDAAIDTETLRAAVSREIIAPVVPANLRAAGYRELINPTGRFVTGGPKGDTGLTGRKIIVDTYGGAAPHGGGAFSGKDPSKVDRSAAYMARFLARQVVARGWSSRVLVQLAYAIGVAEPVSFLVEAEGLTPARSAEIASALRRQFDLTPAGIIQCLDLQRPIYYPTAAYGHFGRDDLDLPWEKTVSSADTGSSGEPVGGDRSSAAAG